MNTYNENLRSSVVNSLDDQANALKKTESALNAQEISLYYDQGALISANDKFDDTLKTYESEQDILASVNENNNAAINVVDAAAQEKKYVDQTISNAAVAASNVQVAANAVVNLAGDIGNVLSIVQAADYKTQIYDQALDAKTYMDQAAYDAKLASQWAMESTMLASSISASNVLSEAQATGTALQNLNDKYKAQFEETSKQLDAENQAVVEANNKEKKSEGLTEDLNIAYFGTKSAYHLNNQELNSGLKVLGNTDGETPKMTDTYFTVNFNPYIAPFSVAADGKPAYPVAAYYLLVVESSAKSTFSVTSAEAVVASSPSGNGQVHPYVLVTQSDLVAGLNGQEYYNKKIVKDAVNDSNGQPIELGKEYCVFLYMVLDDEYKKTINNYSNVLSAGSGTFVLTKQLKAVDNFVLNPTAGEGIDPKNNLQTLTIGDSIKFSVKEKADYPVEYRVMFLPTSIDKVGNLLSDSNLRTVEDDKKMNKKIEHAIANLKTANEALNAAKKKVAELKQPPAEGGAKKGAKGKAIDIDTNITNANQAVKDAEAAVEQATEKLTIDTAEATFEAIGKKGVFFNCAIAEQVPTGAFTKSEPAAGGKFTVTLNEEMTDNFGNKLDSGDAYVPVVLSLSSAKPNKVIEYSNALSNFMITPNFSFSLPNNQ